MYNISERRWVLSLVFVMCIHIFCGDVAVKAQEAALPEVRSPVEEVRTYQDQGRDETLRLVRRALSENIPVDERVKIIFSLGGLNYDFLLANAKSLVVSDTAPVASATVRVLGSQIAMLPNPGGHAGHAGDHNNDPLSVYQDKLVSQTLDVLRTAMQHADSAVREQAAPILASRGDVQSLGIIQTLIDSGKIAPTKGIGYLTLAPTDLASPYIQKYLAAEQTDVRAAAIAQLAYNPAYTTQVRQIVLAPNADKNVLRASLPGLALTDNEFLSYGVALAQNSNIDSAVRTDAVKAVVDATINKRLGDAQVRLIIPSLEETARNLGSRDATTAIETLKQQYKLP